MEGTPVGTNPNLANHIWLIDVTRSRNVFSQRRGPRKCAEAIITSRWGVFDEMTIRIDVSDQRGRENCVPVLVQDRTIRMEMRNNTSYRSSGQF